MTGLLFGGCGCGRTAVYEEQQTVAAMLPWPVGTNFPNIAPLNRPGAVPSVGYLTMTVVYYDSSNNVIWTGITNWNIFGGVTNPPPYTGPPPARSTVAYSNPWTYAQQAAAAAGLLDLVALQNPSATYLCTALGEDGVASPSGPVSAVHFCYDSERTAFAPAPCVRMISIIPTPDGTNYLYFGGADGGGGVAYGSGQIGTIMNGWKPFDNSNLCVAVKIAYRTPYPLISGGRCAVLLDVLDQAWNPGLDETTSYPLSLPAGEYVWGPGDVAGFGMRYWSKLPVGAVGY